MPRYTWTAIGTAALLALFPACSSTSDEPLSPSSTAASAAVANGDSLKVTAPVPQSPTKDQVTNGAPTLTATAATGEFTTLTLKYRFQVFNDAGSLVQDSGLVDAPTFTVTASLSANKRYTWKVRAEFQATAGPWSTVASFTSATSSDPFGNWESSCSSLSGLSLVSCVHGFVKPTDTESDFEVTKRVAWLLRTSGGGLLIKNGGENIVSWQGLSFSASRICFSDGHIFKIISDAGPGGANSPAYSDDDFVDKSLFVPAIDPSKP